MGRFFLAIVILGVAILLWLYLHIINLEDRGDRIRLSTRSVTGSLAWAAPSHGERR